MLVVERHDAPHQRNSLFYSVVKTIVIVKTAVSAAAVTQNPAMNLPVRAKQIVMATRAPQAHATASATKTEIRNSWRVVATRKSHRLLLMKTSMSRKMIVKERATMIACQIQRRTNE
jgi:hypothetical protein